MVYRITDKNKALPIVGGWNETVVKTCLEGRIGSIWSTDADAPKNLLLTAGEFVLFAGEPSEELVSFIPEGYRTNFALMVAEGDDERWYSLIEKVYGTRATRIKRFSIKKEGVSSFDKEHLAALAAHLPEGYETVKIDEELYNYCAGNETFGDFVSQYPTYADYKAHGLGFMCVKDGEPAAGVSSFSDYDGGIEIEIATSPAHRRLGLATAVAARFILECISLGKYPSWDAGNASSLALAEKLGYHLEREYPCYEIENYKSK